MIPALLSTGEDVQIASFEGEWIDLISPRPFAPGAPIALILKAPPQFTLHLKCHGSKRVDEGSFRVRGRTITLRREHRERLVHELDETK